MLFDLIIFGRICQTIGSRYMSLFSSMSPNRKNASYTIEWRKKKERWKPYLLSSHHTKGSTAQKVSRCYFMCSRICESLCHGKPPQAKIASQHTLSSSLNGCLYSLSIRRCVCFLAENRACRSILPCQMLFNSKLGCIVCELHTNTPS